MLTQRFVMPRSISAQLVVYFSINSLFFQHTHQNNWKMIFFFKHIRWFFTLHHTNWKNIRNIKKHWKNIKNLHKNVVLGAALLFFLRLFYYSAHSEYAPHTKQRNDFYSKSRKVLELFKFSKLLEILEMLNKQFLKNFH